MKTKCMSSGGTMKKAQNGGVPKAQKGGFLNMKKVIDKRQAQKTGHMYPYPVKKTISTIKKTISNIIKPKPKPTTPKMKLGGSLETFQRGGSKKSRGWQMDMDPLFHVKDRCDYKKKKKLSQLNARDKAGRIFKGLGKTVLGAGAVVGAGAVAYKKSTPFKNAVDELKGKLGFNKTGGVVKKYKNGGTKKDCPPGYVWNGTDCVDARPLHSLGAKIGVGAGALGLLGIGTLMTIDKIKNMKAKNKAKKTSKAAKELNSKGTVAPKSVFDTIKKQ